MGYVVEYYAKNVVTGVKVELGLHKACKDLDSLEGDDSLAPELASKLEIELEELSLSEWSLDFSDPN